MNFVIKKEKCRWCWSNDIHIFLNLWKMPLAGGFLKKSDIKNETKIPLEVYICKNCKLVQILHVVNPIKLFKNYFYISSIIPELEIHFKEYYFYLKNNFLNKKWSKLLEMWCNDWVLLQNFINDTDIFSLWIDPSENVYKLAKDKWLKVKNDFFNKKSAFNILNEYWKFDVITWSNMFAHIDDISEIIISAKKILKKDGVFIFEVHYLLDLMKGFQYDTIYHEHLTYYSIIAIKKIFWLHNMKIIDVIHLDMHGWGIRVVTSFNNSNHKINKSVNIFIENEINFWLNSLDSYLDFWKKVTFHKDNLLKVLDKIKKEWKNIIWYWAPWRGTILLNYCWIDKKYLDYIVDISPLRQNMLMPWVHLDIKDTKELKHNIPDYILILAWNYSDSIIKQEEELQNKWVKFILPFPKINII